MSLSKNLVSESGSQKTTSVEDKYNQTIGWNLSQLELKDKESLKITTNHRNDSFSYRICDDLCEEILQYLSLKDKLRLECVSKQFQMTAFAKQYEIEIYREGEDKIEDKNLKIESFERLLKKIPNIRSIEISFVRRGVDVCVIADQMLRPIISYCNNLVEFKGLLNDSELNEFQTKFGPKLKSLSLRDRDLIRLNSFPNLQRINFNTSEMAIIPRLKFEILKKMDLTVNEGEEQSLQTLFEKFKNIQYLRLSTDCNNNIKHQNVVSKALKYVKNLKDLIHLEIKPNFGSKPRLFSESLKEIANNCQKLKFIEWTLDFNRRDASNIRQLLSPLEAFKQLKRLKLKFSIKFDESSDGEDYYINEIFSFEAFNELSNITHLYLRFNCSDQLNENILSDIDNYLPKLRYLQIYDSFEEEGGSKRMVDILSRISRLKTIKLSLCDECNRCSQMFAEEVIEKRRQIGVKPHK